MSERVATSFESEWRAVTPAVERFLVARGVPKWLRDDVIQETALRLYRVWDTVDLERGATGLALTIARNALWDERNRRRVVELSGSLPETAAADDVERAGIARLELRRVRDVLGRLSPSHRSVLLAEVGHGFEASGSNDATKMLRLRARRKMRSLLETASAGTFAAISPRSLWRAVRSIRRDGIALVAPTAVMAACGMVALLGTPYVGPLSSKPLERETVAWERSPASPEHRASSTAASRRRDIKLRAGGPAEKGSGQDPAPQGSYWQIGVGDEESPVDGDAGISVRPDPNGEGPRLPECSLSQSGESEAEASCSASAGGHEVTVQTSVAVRP